MKKGTFGTVALILGIVTLVAGALRNAVTSIPVLYTITMGLSLICFIPAIVFGIIGIVKNSNRKLAIVGMALAVAGSFILPLIVRMIVDVL
ncbi:MAG: hypothetical protein IKP98_02420 [Bacilli bacterium]|nr:hypothetical protein [Bacilli bacterium]